MKVIVIPVVLGALGTILKELVKRLEDSEIKRTSRRLEETWCHSNSSKKKSSANAGVKHPKE